MQSFHSGLYVYANTENPLSMNNAKIHLPDLDFDFKLWKETLAFWKRTGELHLLRLSDLHKLGKISSESYGSLRWEYEQQLDKIVALLAKIKVQEDEMAYYHKDYPINMGHQHYKDYLSIRDRMRQLESYTKDLEEEFDYINRKVVLPHLH
ncbi:hypothetical protein PEDI_16800 [Persicobacter diffluens]|uniref:Uncharacterized protein n=2 Tax=Persicobacter diffluens TaxID=981 RepID=A0AAN4VY71_9BACT|nr:hypothetical protein PEDI_16800 [Persicobacter diffluens]